MTPLITTAWGSNDILLFDTEVVIPSPRHDRRHAPLAIKEVSRMNGADRLCDTLLVNDVDVCFANPGTSEMHFVAALDRKPQMR